MFIIALSALQLKSNLVKYGLIITLTISFLLTNYYYVNRGAKNLYYSTAARIGDSFYSALNNGIIQKDKENLFIWEKQRVPDRENEIKWALGNGLFFDLYGGHKKKMIFVDSLFQRSNSSLIFSFQKFNKNRDQIIFLDIQNDESTFKYFIEDITDKYLRDSLDDFNEEQFGKGNPNKKVTYKDNLLIIYDDLTDFVTDGFYQKENGIRWTNGDASIGFKGDFFAKDSLYLELNTYMPQICKNISPKISITGRNNIVYNPLYSGRNGDKFFYKFYFRQFTGIQKINIVSDTIMAHPPDIRRLSFPFISLELNK